jgi:transposase
MFSQEKQREGAAKQKTADGKSKRRRKKGMTLEDRPLREPNAAGIDIGAREIFVAVPADRDENPVRVFPTFTADLEEMAQWLVNCGVTTVAMESTGVYWIPLYDVLERHGITPCLTGPLYGGLSAGKRAEHEECARAQDGLA